MANDYIPRGDAEFNGWLANFVTYANANRAVLRPRRWLPRLNRGLLLAGPGASPDEPGRANHGTSDVRHSHLRIMACPGVET